MKALTIRQKMMHEPMRKMIERLRITDSQVKTFNLVKQGYQEPEIVSQKLGIKSAGARVKLNDLYEQGYLMRENLPDGTYYFTIDHATINQCMIMRAMINDENRKLIESLRLTRTSAHIIQLVKNGLDKITTMKPHAFVAAQGLNAQLNKLIKMGYLDRVKVRDGRGQSVWRYSIKRERYN